MKANQNLGFITLYSVIILGAIGLALVGMLMSTSLWEIKSSGDSRNSSQAQGLANACVDVALQSIHDSQSFTGSGNQNLDGGSCTYLVTNTGGNNRTINATGTVDSVIRKDSVSIDALNPSIHIASWQEVP